MLRIPDNNEANVRLSPSKFGEITTYMKQPPSLPLIMLFHITLTAGKLRLLDYLEEDINNKIDYCAGTLVHQLINNAQKQW